MPTWTFDDFDEYTATIRDVNIEMLLQTLIDRRWTIRQVEVGGIHIQHGRQGSGDITQGQAGPEGVVIYVPLAHESGQRANGTALDENTVVIFEPGAEFNLSSNIDHAWCTVFVPNDKLGGFDGAKRCRPERVAAGTARRYCALVKRILATVEAYEPAASSPTLEVPLSELTRQSFQLINHESTAPETRIGRPALPRNEIVRRATKLMDAPRKDVPAIGEIAAACEVSERTLRSVFQEYYGSAPLRYLHLRHLHRVRRALRAADPHADTVGEILLRHGEWEFGRFARRYRKAFGEAPHDTLQASPGRNDSHG